jgi:hypothetical protein
MSYVLFAMTYKDTPLSPPDRPEGFLLSRIGSKTWTFSFREGGGKYLVGSYTPKGAELAQVNMDVQRHDRRR